MKCAAYVCKAISVPPQGNDNLDAYCNWDYKVYTGFNPERKLTR